jgi:2-polyprenyl-3-methyl-5-hydroxy-6-metoxy-1,4-benzoquinol methylase
MDGFKVVECSGCGLLFLDMSEDVNVTSLYSSNYYLEREEYYFKNSIIDPVYGHENPNIRDFREGLELIETYRKPPGRLLDIGCAMGVFLAIAKERGWKVFGVDVSDYATKFAKERFGINCFTGDIRDARLPDKHFNVITLWDTIEHFENPLEELKEIRRILTDDGIILFDTPNVESIMRILADWAYKITGGIFKYPIKKLYHQFHLFYFSPKTLHMLLNKTGFEIIEIRKKTIPINKARGNRLEKVIVKGLSILEKATNREYELFVIARKARSA